MPATLQIRRRFLRHVVGMTAAAWRAGADERAGANPTRGPTSTWSPAIEAFPINSSQLGRKLQIRLTTVSGTESARLVELYVLDPSFNLGVAVAAADFLA